MKGEKGEAGKGIPKGFSGMSFSTRMEYLYTAFSVKNSRTKSFQNAILLFYKGMSTCTSQQSPTSLHAREYHPTITRSYPAPGLGLIKLDDPVNQLSQGIVTAKKTMLVPQGIMHKQAIKSITTGGERVPHDGGSSAHMYSTRLMGCSGQLPARPCAHPPPAARHTPRENLHHLSLSVKREKLLCLCVSSSPRKRITTRKRYIVPQAA